MLLEQLSRVLPSDSESLPDQVILANTCDRQGAHLATKLAEETTNNGDGSASDQGPNNRVIFTAGPADVKATLTCLVAKIQKFCNTQTQTPPSVKVALIGSDTFINSVLRPYVEVFSTKPPDWQSYIKFFIIPLGKSSFFLNGPLILCTPNKALSIKSNCTLYCTTLSILVVCVLIFQCSLVKSPN